MESLNRQYRNLKESEMKIDFNAASKHMSSELNGCQKSQSLFEEKYNKKEADKAIEWSLDACAFLANSSSK